MIKKEESQENFEPKILEHEIVDKEKYNLIKKQFSNQEVKVINTGISVMNVSIKMIKLYGKKFEKIKEQLTKMKELYEKNIS